MANRIVVHVSGDHLGMPHSWTFNASCLAVAELLLERYAPTSILPTEWY